MAVKRKENASSGHKLGQLIGDWLEEFFVLPLLNQVAETLQLFLDSRFIQRDARGEKIVWKDEDGNSVDYDFVLELGGTLEKLGLPVAFFECCWRRGARHSKDKARDDSGKLIPMRNSYPTTRFLGIVWAGICTVPARDLLRSRDIDLFYIPKNKIVEAFGKSGLAIDYPDKTPEKGKRSLASSFEMAFTRDKHEIVADALIELIGPAAVSSFINLIRARLSALPQEIRIVLRHESLPLIFASADEVTRFLEEPSFQMDNPTSSFVYQVTYSDGVEFEKAADSIDALKVVHSQVQRLAEHAHRL